MRPSLTSKQKQTYEALRGFWAARGFSPTLSELRGSLHVQSLNAVVRRLAALERKGYIIRRKRAKRNIEILDADRWGNTPPMVNIRVVASIGCDDLRTFADEQHDEFLQVDRKLIEGREPVAVIRAVGDSMTDADIHNGDYVLVQVTEAAKNGDRVVAVVGDMATVKKLERRDDATILWPESNDPSYKPIVLREDFKIAGKVLSVIQNPRRDDIRVIPLPLN